MELSTILILVFSWLLIAIGFLGCFIHKFPGPVTAFIGMLVFIFGMQVPVVPWVGIVICVLLLIITALANKKFIPWVAKQISDFSNGGKWGAVIGSLIGLLVIAYGANSDSNGMKVLLALLGFGVIPFCSALLGEFASRKDMGQSLKPAAAAYLTYLMSMILKLAVCCYAVYIIITNGN